MKLETEIWALSLEFEIWGWNVGSAARREGDWNLWARIWALRLETGRWGKLEKEKEASRPRRTQ